MRRTLIGFALASSVSASAHAFNSAYVSTAVGLSSRLTKSNFESNIAAFCKDKADKITLPATPPMSCVDANIEATGRVNNLIKIEANKLQSDDVSERLKAYDVIKAIGECMDYQELDRVALLYCVLNKANTLAARARKEKMLSPLRSD